MSVHKNKGFTLIELSVVIVLIGLIVASVLGGKNLILQAKIQSQISDINKYEIAYNAFKLEYDSIPGDLSRASSYWTGARNGNGNKRLTQMDGAGIGSPYENMLFFEHLSLANLLESQYSESWDIGSAYPKLKIDESKGMLAGSNIRGSGANCNPHQINSALCWKVDKAALYLNVGQAPAAGNPGPIVNTYNDITGTHSPQTYSAKDKKIDDGLPITGKFLTYSVWNSGYGNCLTGIDGSYSLSNDQPACNAKYILEK